jgi:hypothetical protein
LDLREPEEDERDGLGEGSMLVDVMILGEAGCRPFSVEMICYVRSRLGTLLQQSDDDESAVRSWM